VPVASLPDPWHPIWHVGTLSVRAYALCVAVAIAAGVWITAARYQDRAVILDVAAWAVPFGLAGAAVHAILVSAGHDFKHQPLWTAATTSVAAIGIPGAIGLGAVGAWIAARRAGLELGPVAGAAAPGVAVGLAIGTLGHWWAQDFYGQPAAWWLAERVAPEHRVPGYQNYSSFQPAFLLQSAWDVFVAVAVLVAARRLALSGERVFLLGGVLYAAGSLWVEAVRIGPLPGVLGLPYQAWDDLIVFIAAAAVLIRTRPRTGQGRPVLTPDSPPDTCDVIST
jgi:prolipoprotein diacylglyceryltransferase